MDIQSLLKSYKDNIAKIMQFEYDIEGLEDIIKRDREELIYNELDEIEGHVLEAASLSDMPRGNTNKFHSSTESAAFLPPPKNETNIDRRERIKILKSRKYPIERDVKYVENVILPSLDAKDNLIIRMFYNIKLNEIIGLEEKKYTWDEISVIYSKRFEPKEPDTLKNEKSNIIKYFESLVKISA